MIDIGIKIPTVEASEVEIQTQLKKWNSEMEARLGALTTSEQQWYLEGLVHAYDAMDRYGFIAGKISFIERELFIEAMKSTLAKQAEEQRLSVGDLISKLRETDIEYVKKAMDFANRVQYTLLQISTGDIQMPNLALIGQTESFENRAKELAAIPATPAETGQFIFGLYQAFDAVNRYARYDLLTPLDRVNFIGSAKSLAYSNVYWLKLDPETRLRPLVESDYMFYAFALMMAQLLHKLFCIPLTIEQDMNIQQALFMCGMRKPDF